MSGQSCLVRRLSSRPRTRSLSTALHFYQNRQLDIYAAKEAHRLTLRQLVRDFSYCRPTPAQPYQC